MLFLYGRNNRQHPIRRHSDAISSPF